ARCWREAGPPPEVVGGRGYVQQHERHEQWPGRASRDDPAGREQPVNRRLREQPLLPIDEQAWRAILEHVQRERHGVRGERRRERTAERSPLVLAPREQGH